MLLVLNKMDRRSGITRPTWRRRIKHPVKGQISLDEKVVLSSINAGVPFMTGSRNPAGAQGMPTWRRSSAKSLRCAESPAAEEEDGKETAGRLFNAGE